MMISNSLLIKCKKISSAFGSMHGATTKLVDLLSNGHSEELGNTLLSAVQSKERFTLQFGIDRARQFSQLSIFKNIDFEGLILKLENLQGEALDKNIDASQNKNFLKHWFQVWFSELDIETRAIHALMEDYQGLIMYLYICELMIRCQEGAVRVSPEVWEGIESRILTVPATSEDNTD